MDRNQSLVILKVSLSPRVKFGTLRCAIWSENLWYIQTLKQFKCFNNCNHLDSLAFWACLKNHVDSRKSLTLQDLLQLYNVLVDYQQVLEKTKQTNSLTSSMNTKKSILEGIALHNSLEPIDIRTIVLNQIINIDISSPVTRDPDADVASQTSRVIG